MKTNYYSILLALLAFSIGLNVCLLYERPICMDKHVFVNENFDNPVFIWNDDLESIPMDNTPVLLQFGSKNSDTLYLGPLEQNAAEYQFIVTDDSITVKDFGKQVGSVKLEGQLKQLINEHNK
jgi:hypothetical protein